MCVYYSQCEFVVPQIESPQHVQICHYCECKYESRNTTTIKVKNLFLNSFVWLGVVKRGSGVVLSHMPCCVSVWWGGQEGARCCCLAPHALLCQCEVAGWVVRRGSGVVLSPMPYCVSVRWGGQEGVRCCLVPHALLCQC